MLATSCPSSQISPEAGRSRHPIRFTKVLLPEPEGPITASHSPGSTEREISSRARMTPPPASARAGYSLLTFFSLIISLASQYRSRLHPPQEANRQHRRQERHGHAAGHHHRQHAEPRYHRAWKFTRPIQAATPIPITKPSNAPATPSAPAS